MKRDDPLAETINIEGTLLMLDDVTPHVAVPVQAVCGGAVIATALSDEQGRYQFINLEPGQCQLRCHVPDGYIYYGEEKAGESISLRVRQGETLKNIDFRIAPFKKGTWSTYNYLDGLVNNRVSVICLDPDGTMWFGTLGGVSRYDGKEFINFTTEDGLVHNHVVTIHRDPDGVMWFGTNGGVSCYDGKTFVNLTVQDGLVNNDVHTIYRDHDGALWFGTAGGVSRYDGKTFRNLTPADGLADDIVQTIHCDSQGMMWFGTGDVWDGGHGIFRYDGKTVVNFITQDGLPSNRVHAIHCDSNGMLWFGTWGGVSRYDGKEFINLTAEDGLAHNWVTTIHRDPDDIMWFGTFGGGVSRYDGKGFVNLTKEDGLADDRVRDINHTPDGVMWFATWTGGVCRYDEKRFINLTMKDGLADNYVQLIHRDPNGVMWFGTWKGGVSRYDGKGVMNLTTEDGLADNWVWAIHRDLDGVMWFGTYGGVSRYDGKEFVNFTTDDGLVDDVVTASHCDPDGVMWFGTWWSGVSRYDGKEFINFTTDDGLAGIRVLAIHRDPDGVMWFGTLGGVSRYDGKEFINFTTEDGLVHNHVVTIHRDPDGVMWFGTSGGGVSRYDGEGFVNLNTKDGLADNVIPSIHRGSDGVMWFGTFNGGISMYDGAAWVSLDTRDGLAGNTVGSICQDPDGSLWFATDEGITRYRRSTVPPKVYIVSVTTDQTYRDLSAIPAFTPGTRVTIEYSFVDLKTVPEKRQYRCQIQAFRRGLSEGEIDSDWRSPTRETSFDWIPDETGTYTFAVQAIDCDLNYSNPATLSLTVQPDPKFVSMQMELDDLRHEVGRKYHFQDIIGSSTKMKTVRALMERAIDSGLTVLITGETGTGKELVAKAIHYNSPRKDGPMLNRNCGAIPGELVASELFGHHKGAFTGADEDRIGLFEAASGGTVFLDEIGEMPQDAQVHLLRVLDDRKIRRIGGNISQDVDVRVIAATNRDLRAEVEEGRFREDLYYRLSVLSISIPPIRERREDIPVLAEHFLQEYSAEQKKELDGFAPGVLDMLQSHTWSGNVRELQNVINVAVAFAEEGQQIQLHHFPRITEGESLMQAATQAIGQGPLRYREMVNQFERRCIEHALRECNGNRTQAAKMLGIERKYLYEKIKRFHIDIPKNISPQPTNE
ncbi:sigma 54-interacting transcriptional regulator [Candidatus Poribacteria bacterium]